MIIVPNLNKIIDLVYVNSIDKLCPSCNNIIFNKIRRKTRRKKYQFECLHCGLSIFEKDCISKPFCINNIFYEIIWRIDDAVDNENYIISDINSSGIGSYSFDINFFIPFNIDISGFEKILLLK